MKPLMMTIGGAGANVGKDFRAVIEADAKIAAQTDVAYANLTRAFLKDLYIDTNETELAFAPEEQRLIIGDGEGSGNNPIEGRQIFEAAKDQIGKVLDEYDTLFPIASLNKGTGAGGILPACQWARERNMLVVPLIIFPDLDTNEVQKPQYDFALETLRQLDEIPVRYIVINNARGYELGLTRKKAHRALNHAAVKGMRALFYTFLEGRQLDRKDIARVFAGKGHIRMGYVEMGTQVDKMPVAEKRNFLLEAASTCLRNQFYDFEGNLGRSVLCIHGPFQMNTIGEINKAIAAVARVDEKADHRYHSVNVQAEFVPPPYGITGLFCSAPEGEEPAPLNIDWKTDGVVSLPDKYIEGPGDDDDEAIPATVRSTSRIKLTSADAPRLAIESVVSVSESERVVATPVPVEEPATPSANRSHLHLATASTAKPATSKPAPPPARINFISWLRRMGELDPYYLQVAVTGNLEDAVVFTPEEPDEVIEWLPQPQFSGLVTKRRISERNMDYIYEFVKSNVPFNPKLKVTPEKGKAIFLGEMDASQLRTATEHSMEMKDVRLLRLLKAMVDIYEPGRVLLLVRPQPNEAANRGSVSILAQGVPASK